MKVTKAYLHKEVRITWLDPISNHEKLVNLSDPVRKGRAALAKWIERGIIDDITDGVIRVVQSQSFSPGEETPDEAIIGWIPEELIEEIEIGEFKKGE